MASIRDVPVASDKSTTLRERLADEGQRLRQALLKRRLLGFLLLAVVLISLAYQVRFASSVDVGGLDDCPALGKTYRCPTVDDWNARETDPSDGTTYRWSGGISPLRFAGVGNQPLLVTIRLSGARPNATPPAMRAEINGREYTWQTQAAFTAQSFNLPRQANLNGDLNLTLLPPAFSPQNDARELGVRVDSVMVASVEGLHPVLPDLGVLLALLGCLLLLWLLLYRAFGEGAALLGGGLALLIFAALLAFNRLAISSFAPQLAVVLLWATLLAGLTLLLWPRRVEDSQAVGWLAGAVAVAFVLRFGGMVYPQFISIDLNFHADKLAQVLRFFQGKEANFYFQSELPTGVPVPYPSAYYVLLAPFSALLGGGKENDELLLRFFTALLDSAAVLAVTALARPFGRRVAGFAAILYAVGPAVFDLLSAGTHSNVFGQAMFTISLACALPILQRERGSHGWRGWLVAYLVFALLTLLGHYGTALASLVIVGAVGFVWLVLAPKDWRGRIWPLLTAQVVAAVLAYLLYYVHYTYQMGVQLDNILSGGKKFHSVKYSIRFDLLGLLADLLRWQGWVILPLAVLGAGGLLVSLRQRTIEDDGQAAARLLLIGWLLAGVALIASGLFDRYTVRFEVIVMPLSCILAALTLGWLSERSRLAAGVLVGLAAVYLLVLWSGVVLTGYH